MDNTSVREQLIKSVGNLNEDVVNTLVLKRIELGEDPLRIIEDCQEGLRLVGEKYEQGEYFISGLIMAGEILRQVMTLIKPKLNKHKSNLSKGCVLIGTVEGDIHDLGKSILNILLTCHGFTVHDLGVDVPPAVFVEHVERLKPDIVGLSGLLTVSHKKMKETIDLMCSTSELTKNTPVIIGGGQTNERVARMVGAKLWCNNAIEGVNICQNLLANTHSRQTS